MSTPKKPARNRASAAALAAATAFTSGEKRGFFVTMRLNHDGKNYDVGDVDPVFVTEAEFDVLQAAQVFDAETDWYEGESLEVEPEPEKVPE